LALLKILPFLLRSSLSSSEIKVCGCLRRVGIGSASTVCICPDCLLDVLVVRTGCSGRLGCNSSTAQGRRAEIDFTKAVYFYSFPITFQTLREKTKKKVSLIFFGTFYWEKILLIHWFIASN